MFTPESFNHSVAEEVFREKLKASISLEKAPKIQEKALNFSVKALEILVKARVPLEKAPRKAPRCCDKLFSLISQFLQQLPPSVCFSQSSSRLLEALKAQVSSLKSLCAPRFSYLPPAALSNFRFDSGEKLFTTYFEDPTFLFPFFTPT
jgi:hypothetical protein